MSSWGLLSPGCQVGLVGGAGLEGQLPTPQRTRTHRDYPTLLPPGKGRGKTRFTILMALGGRRYK